MALWVGLIVPEMVMSNSRMRRVSEIRFERGVLEQFTRWRKGCNDGLGDDGVRAVRFELDGHRKNPRLRFGLVLVISR